MKRTDTALNLTSVVNNDRAATRSSVQSLTRDASLSIDYDETEEAFVVRAWGDLTFPNDGLRYLGTLNARESDVYVAVKACRDVWKKHVLERSIRRGETIDHPFVNRWNLHGADAVHLRAVGLELARAGKDLFDFVFGAGDEGLREIGVMLTSALRARECVISIESDRCFVPWHMLYTPPDPSTDLLEDGATWDISGFWGCKHVIEHQLSRRARGFAIQPERGGPAIGVNVDQTLDEEFDNFNARMIRFFKHFKTVSKESVNIRDRRLELNRAIVSPDYRDDIVYFGCHAKVEGDDPPALFLTDQTPIVHTDFQNWFGSHPQQRRPVVFVNACEGGQMSSRFYQGFSKVLLECGANCLIGSQIDLPAVFAGEFARRFFQQFLQGRRRAGEILKSLTLEFATAHHNPLGLIYSMYHGTDTHLTRRIS